MEDYIIEKIEANLEKEVLIRSLAEYFINKGFKSLDIRVYPPALQDLVSAVPILDGKIEVVPTIEELDPRTSYCKLRWDLFVLGNNRLMLGFSEHTNLQELATNWGAGMVMTEDKVSSNESTAKRIIGFISRILSASRAGRTKPAHLTTTTGPLSPLAIAGMTFYRRGQPIRQEYRA